MAIHINGALALALTLRLGLKPESEGVPMPPRLKPGAIQASEKKFQ